MRFQYKTAILPAMEYTTDDIFHNSDYVTGLWDNRAAQLYSIIAAPNFAGIELPYCFGTYYLHKSTRAGIDMQLSRLQNGQ